jgi:hypothetical protein
MTGLLLINLLTTMGLNKLYGGEYYCTVRPIHALSHPMGLRTPRTKLAGASPDYGGIISIANIGPSLTTVKVLQY